MENKKKYIAVAISILLVATIMLIGFTFAYYRTRIVGNKSEEPSISVQSKKIEVVYSDDKSTITADSIDLGWSATKEFSVENTGDETIKYNIIFDNVSNEFDLPGWFYELFQVLPNGEKESVTPGVLLKDEVQVVTYDIAINPGETHNYELNIFYDDIGEDQSDDMGKSMSLRVNIEETLQVPSGPTTSENVTINYHTNYPASNYIMHSETIVRGTDYAIANIVPERGELYTFIGWSQDFTCDESVSPIMSSGIILQNVQTNIELYDCWSVQTG